MSKKSGNSGGGISLNKFSFWLIVVVAVLYLVSTILSACGVASSIISWIQNVASAITLCIVAILAWRYVRNKQTVWKVLYFIVLLVAIVGLILPAILL